MTRTFSAVLARTGVPTGDGRILAPGVGTSRALPLPLSYQYVTDEGHAGSIVVGRIESMAFGDGMVTATGSLLESAQYGPVVESLEAGVIGPSVDLDDIEYVMDDRENLVLTKWRVAGATLVAIPAFADVSLTLDPMPVDPVEVTEGTESVASEDWLYASAAPPLPPLDWFAKPDLSELTPITVSDTGRVFGHIAGRDTCHVGLPGCVTAPMGYSDYSYFHVAEQATQEGPVLPVGTLVAGPRHADPQLAFQAAQQHYDDPTAAVARVMAGEDEHGIWVAGWILPTASDEAKAVFRSSPVSGDWRRVGGRLELVAVCSVNTPGFPVPRARVAFAMEQQRTLIASTGIKPVEGTEGTEPVASGGVSGEVLARWAWARTGMES